MSSILKVCLYNAEPESSAELKTQIQAVNFVRLIAEVSTPDELASRLSEDGVSLVFFHLDPNPEAVIDVIDDVSSRYPDMAMIALSHATDPQSILAPMRVGCDQFVCEPIDASDLSVAVSRVASRRLASRTKSRCICVASPTGGSGATSVACNLALEIGHLVERECALVDLDLQFGNVSENFDASPRYNVSDLGGSIEDLDRVMLESTLESLPCRVSLLARPEAIEQCESVTPDIIIRIIDLLTNMYENVVIDLPGRFDPQTIAAIGKADLVVVVCQLQVPSIRNAKRYFDTLVSRGVPADFIEFAVNRTEGRAGRITIEDVEDTFGKSIYASIPNDYQFVARSIDLGRPIVALDRKNPVRVAIRKMAAKIVAVDAANSTRRRAPGIINRILSR